MRTEEGDEAGGWNLDDGRDLQCDSNGMYAKSLQSCPTLCNPKLKKLKHSSEKFHFGLISNNANVLN